MYRHVQFVTQMKLVTFNCLKPVLVLKLFSLLGFPAFPYLVKISLSLIRKGKARLLSWDLWLSLYTHILVIMGTSVSSIHDLALQGAVEENEQKTFCSSFLP